MTTKTQKPVQDAQTPVTTFDDGQFVRTAIKLTDSDKIGSIDILDASGRRMVQINLITLSAIGTGIIVDVINVDGRYKTGRALAFSQTDRKIVDVPKGGRLISCDFREE